MFGFSKTQVVIGAALAAAGAVAIYRNVRNWTKPKQTTDQPLHVWVNNSDYDESFACDVLTACPRVVAVYLARAAFWPTLYWTGIKALVSKSNRWMDRIDENVILGALFEVALFPLFLTRKTKELGVGLVINTCEEWNGNAEEYAKLGIQQVVVETIDYTAPELEQAEQAVGAMQEFLKSNPEKKVASKRQQTTRVELIRKQIYVHCKAGRGRSATILICFYVAKGLSPLEAQKLLSKQRPQVSSRCWKRKVVKDYVKRHVL